MQPARTCCLDLDTFFVSVERLLNPALVGQPVVVGAATGLRGVVTAASYEVRAFGVRSGMPIREARALAPHAIYLDTRHGVYGPYAARVKAILERYTPVVRTASIDEFFLDFGGCESLYRVPTDVDGCATIERTVRAMRQAIQDEVGLPASAGIGTNRAIAKMASGAAKPAGVLMVRAGSQPAFVLPLPVRKFPGIGPVTEEKMKASGILTLGQLLQASSAETERFRRMVDAVQACVDGVTDDGDGPERPAFLEHDPAGARMGSLSNERTFGNERNQAVIEHWLLALCERVCWRARKRSIMARTFTLKLRYSDFETITRARTRAATHHEREVFDVIRGLFRENWVAGRAVRLVGVQLSNLEAAGPPPPPPPNPNQTTSRPAGGTAIDKVRGRFGYDAIRVGATTAGRER